MNKENFSPVECEVCGSVCMFSDGDINCLNAHCPSCYEGLESEEEE